MESEPEHDGRDWCGMAISMVVASVMALIGFSLIAQGTINIGLVLLFVGGAIMVLTMCAALGKCRAQDEEKIAEDNTRQDRPPSYRISWRRSFLRRHRARRPDTDLTEVSSGAINETRNNNPTSVATHATGLTHQLSARSRDPFATPSHYASCNVLLGHSVEDGLNSHLAGIEPRHTQSMANLLDPPSYEAALANLNEGDVRKLKSEDCLHSLT